MAEHFHALRVAEIVPETDEANSIRFEVPPSLRERLRVQGRPASDAARRHRRRGSAAQLFAVHRARTSSDWMVTVKRIAGGRLFQLGRRQAEGRRHDRRDAAARQLHDRVRCRRPSATIVGFAGGSGITPVMSLIRTALSDEPQSRFTLFYGNRDSQLGHLPRGAGGPEGPLHRAGSSSTISSPRRRATSTCSTACSTARRCDEAIDASGRRSARASTPGSSAVPGR